MLNYRIRNLHIRVTRLVPVSAKIAFPGTVMAVSLENVSNKGFLIVVLL